jgi:hypothetical protein
MSSGRCLRSVSHGIASVVSTAQRVHSRRRPVITSGQSCARMKGSTSDKFIVMRRDWRCVQVQAAELSGQHLRRRGGRPCAQSEKRQTFCSSSRMPAADVSLRPLWALALRSAKPCAFPLCLCEDETTTLRHASASTSPTHSTPISPTAKSASSTSTAPSALTRVL